MLVPLNDEVRMLHSSDILEPLSEEELEDLAKNNPDVRLEEGETSMVGANRVSVTRAFGTLRESGVVELRRRLIYVKDLQALGNIATESRRAKQIEDSED